MTRLPLRWRVSLAFAVVMAVILGLTGIWVHTRLRADLDEGVTEGLRTRADAVARLSPGAEGLRRPQLSPDADSVAQLIDPDGRVASASPGSVVRPVVDAATLRAARAREQVVEVTGPNGDRFRVVATAAAGGRVALVGESLEDRRDEPLRLVAALLLAGLSVALVLATAAGYHVVRAALRPVERLRAEAERITGDAGQRRLPVPPGDDELARLGNTLNAMLDRILAAQTRQRAFVADAAHELRTPLAVLAAETELALRAGTSPQEQRAALRSNQEEIGRLTRLGDDLLALARADEARPAPAADEAVAVGPLLDHAVARIAATAGGRRVSVVAGAGELRVAAAREEIERAVTALVDNALRHGAGAIELAGTTEADGHVRISVADRGPGLPADLLPIAFERFTQGAAGRARGGSGLGLALVAAAAIGRGGRVGAATRPGGGAEVWFTLPPAARGHSPTDS